MFGNYSIETASRHPSSLAVYGDEDNYSVEALRPVSPFDTRTSHPATSSIYNLSEQLGRQRLDCQSIDQPAWDYADTPSPLEPEDPTSPSDYWSTPRSTLACRRRLQRQSNIRLLCDPAHLESISKLMAQMIDSGDQCVISRTRSNSIPPVSVEDDAESIDSDLSSPRSMSGTSNDGFSPLAYSQSRRPGPLKRNTSSGDHRIRKRGQKNSRA